jgi:hypothetical protein
MRILMIAAALALSGCATAVNDSLDRRGVDAKTIFTERVAATRNDAARAQSAFSAAAAELQKVGGLDGAALSRQLDQARAAGQDAALSAQDLRLSIDTAKAAGSRLIQKKEEELALMKTSEETLRAARADLDALKVGNRTYLGAFDAAKLRLSPALSLYDAEVTALRRNATSRIAAEARAGERASAIEASNDAAQSLGAAVVEADRFLDGLR